MASAVQKHPPFSRRSEPQGFLSDGASCFKATDMPQLESQHMNEQKMRNVRENKSQNISQRSLNNLVDLLTRHFYISERVKR